MNLLRLGNEIGQDKYISLLHFIRQSPRLAEVTYNVWKSWAVETHLRYLKRRSQGCIYDGLQDGTIILEKTFNHWVERHYTERTKTETELIEYKSKVLLSIVELERQETYVNVVKHRAYVSCLQTVINKISDWWRNLYVSTLSDFNRIIASQCKASSVMSKLWNGYRHH